MSSESSDNESHFRDQTTAGTERGGLLNPPLGLLTLRSHLCALGLLFGGCVGGKFRFDAAAKIELADAT
jgi:hypothetical protein